MENSLNQNKVWGWGETGPDVLPEYLAEERDHAIVEMDTRQRRAGRSTGKIGLASGKKYLTPRQKDYIVGHLGEP